MNRNVQYLTIGAFFIALAVIMPVAFHAFSQTAGIVFSPLQLPVMLSALFLPVRYAALVGFLAPLASSLLTGMPPLLPMAPVMAVECLTYAVVLRIMLQRNNVITSLLVSMVVGRIVYLIAAGLFFSGFSGTGGVLGVLTASFSKAWAAMLLQIIVVPAVKKISDKMPVRKTVQKNIRSAANTELRDAKTGAGEKIVPVTARRKKRKRNK